MRGSKGKGGGVAGVGGTSCVYQALFLSPYLGISFISHPCDLQIGALVAGALIQLVWCGISVWPPGQGLGEFAPQGTQPLLASGPGMLTVVSSVVFGSDLSSGGESHQGRRLPTTHPKTLVPARWWFLVQFIPETMETSCCPSPAGD